MWGKREKAKKVFFSFTFVTCALKGKEGLEGQVPPQHNRWQDLTARHPFVAPK